jgi:hypothetical protein
MRNIFLILLLANLLLLGWLLWVDPEPPAVMQATAGNELAIYEQESPVATSDRGDIDASSLCVYIGPVPDAIAAQQLSAALAARGIKAEPVPREARVWLGHWVQVQGFADKERAEIARQRLLAGGLPDAYVMQDGPMTVISLGVFRERSRAERIIEAARRAGFTAVMRDRIRPAAEYWLVSDRANGQQAALRDLAVGYDRILRTDSLPCPASVDLLPEPVEPE